MNRSRSKFWCESCDYVTKSLGSAVCPLCREPMRNMGPKWRVGKKGHREDWRPRQESFWWWFTDSPLHGGLMKKLTGQIRWDKKRGRWVEIR